MRWSLWGALLVTLLAAAPAEAAGLLIEPTPVMVADIVARMRPFIGEARLPDGSKVPAETAAELAEPVIPPPLAERIVRRGVLTAEMQLCGLDWAAESFLPFMAALRGGGGLTPKQLAFAGVLHGGAQQIVVGALTGTVTGCSKERITTLRAIRDRD